MAALIAFYSRAGENYFGGAYRRISVGNTEKVAEMLADLTGGELYKIEQAEPYSDDYKTCVAQAREDWQKNARPAVLDLPDDLDAYDEIYLGYPNYCSTMPMAVYTFLEHYDFTGKTIHPFCTHEGSGLSDTKTTSARLPMARRSRRASPSTAATWTRRRARLPSGLRRSQNEKAPDRLLLLVVRQHRAHRKSVAERRRRRSCEARHRRAVLWQLQRCGRSGPARGERGL